MKLKVYRQLKILVQLFETLDSVVHFDLKRRDIAKSWIWKALVALHAFVFEILLMFQLASVVNFHQNY